MITVNGVRLLPLAPLGYFVFQALPGTIVLDFERPRSHAGVVSALNENNKTNASDAAPTPETSVELDVKAGEVYYVSGYVDLPSVLVGHRSATATGNLNAHLKITEKAAGERDIRGTYRILGDLPSAEAIASGSQRRE